MLLVYPYTIKALNKLAKPRFLIIPLLLLFTLSNLFPNAQCDKRRGCTDRAIEFDRNSGASRSHVFVDYRPFLSNMEDGFTFEAKIKLEEFSGERIYIAGIWGPNEEDNDAWVIYIDESGNMVFEVENPVTIPRTDNRNVDNTRAVSGNFVGNVGSWTHIAAVFDPILESAFIYIDGQVAGSNRNAVYPITRMNTPNNRTLGMLVGSANKVTDPEGYRSFKGEMDEIKLWDEAKTADWIDCNKNLAYYKGNNDLILYYRANDPINSYELCDASDNGNEGSLRDARLKQGSFPAPSPFKIYEQPTFPDTLKCVTTKTYRFVIEDTSSCASGLNIRAWTWEVNDENRLINRNSSDLVPLNPSPQNIQDGILTYEFEINADWVGTKRYELRLQRNNGCGWVAYRNQQVYITRITDVEIDIGNDTLDFGKISSFCESEQTVTESITISNNSDVTGTNRPLNVSGIAFSDTRFTLAGPAIPFTVPVGGSRQVDINFANPNLAGLYQTDITLTTDDQCSDGVYNIPAQIEVEDVFEVLARNGEDSIVSHDFGTVCLGRISRALTFYTENLSSRDITLLDVSYPNGYDTRVDRDLPKELPANRSFSDEYFLLMPQNEGNYDGTIMFTVETDNGCIIKYPVEVTGRAINPDFEFTIPDIDYGNVVVGQEMIIPVEIRNKSNYDLRVNLALNRSEVYFFVGGPTLNIPPLSTRTKNIAFRPTADNLYLDKLIAWETECNNTYTLDIRGQGIFEALEFSPEITRIDDVLGCESGEIDGSIRNISSQSLSLNNFSLDDPNNRFDIISINGSDISDIESYNINLGAGEQLAYTALYTPNDVTVERGDRAYLRFRDERNLDWSAKLYGTSRLPRLFISRNGQFGTKEVGDTEIRTLYVENVSAGGDVTLDDISLTNGDQDFTILYPSSEEINATVLGIGDTMQIKVQFSPSVPGSFNDTVIISTTAPCSITGSEALSGFGRTYPLQMGIRDMAMGYAAACECQEKVFYLNNDSENFPISIDSIYFDDTGLNYPSSRFYDWSSVYSPSGISPYEIPADTRDTLTLTYCPRQKPDRDSIINESYFRMSASGEGWGPDTFGIYLIGKRKLLFEPTPDSTSFPPTRVDTLSQPQIAYIKVPNDVNLNPDNAVIKIDSITFQPDNKVFTASDSLGRGFPIYVSDLDSMNIQFDFYPRAPRLYEAKALLHISEPCVDIDSTLLVRGMGFAPAFGLAFHIDKPENSLDSIIISQCDTIVMPFYTSRQVPADVVDINFRLNYDKSKYQLLDIQSDYFVQSDFCSEYVTDNQLISSTDTNDYRRLKNFCSVDSLKPMFTARFIPNGITRDTSIISIDSIFFDSEDVILYEVLAESDAVRVIVKETSFEVVGDIEFPDTQVLDCTEMEYLIHNDGQLPISISDVIGTLGDTIAVVTGQITGDSISPGDTSAILLRFCPKKSGQVTGSFAAFIERCGIEDSSVATGLGFAPDFTNMAGTENSFVALDTVFGQIGEIIELDLDLEKDIKIEFDGLEYYMENVSFKTDINWNPRALKFLDFESNGIFTPEFFNENPGELNLEFKNESRVLKGDIGKIRFLVTVPDMIESPINIENHSFESDDIMFYNLQATENELLFSSSQSCNITLLTYTNEISFLSQNYPNPWSQKTTIDFSISEIDPVMITIYDISGNKIKEFIYRDGMELGNHSIELESQEFESGVYLYELENGVFRDTKFMNVVK
jgi:hypothetical protein